MRRSLILIAGSLVLYTGCQDVPKHENLTAAEIPECRVGDVCAFRHTFGSALVFTNMRAYERFRRSSLETPDESYQLWRDWEATGDWAVLRKAMRICVLKEVTGGVEALVERDDYRPAPNGGIGMVGTKIAGHKVWLEGKLAPMARWQRAN